MAHKYLIRSETLPYHVYARSNNRESFYIPLSEFWDILIKYSVIISEDFQVRFHALVLMPNHFHLLVSTPRANLDEAMNYFQREISRSVNRSVGRINHLFGGRYKWSVIDNSHYYENALRYLYQNPIRANLCASVEAYPFSSIRSENVAPLQVTMVPHRFEETRLANRSCPELACWFNSIPGKDVNEYLAKALRKRRFQLNARCPVLD